jgi:hypothetical protein
MLITVETEIFLSPARVLVNPVNTAGVMASGVSAEFKRFFPDAFASYRSLCEAGQFEPGRLYVHRAPYRTIVHIPIKRHWRTAASGQALEAGLQRLAIVWAEYGLHALGVPRFDEDELPWETLVQPLLETYLAPLPIPVYIHSPSAADGRRSIRQIDQHLNMAPARIPFDRAWQEIGRIVRRTNGVFRTSDGQPFMAAYESRGRYGRLIVTPDGERSITILESSLNDLWTMLNLAGLVLPSQFPGGLELAAPYVTAVLAKSDMVRAVRTAIGGGPTAFALLLVAPAPPIEPVSVLMSEAS